jgi:hypothetical protein
VSATTIVSKVTAEHLARSAYPEPREPFQRRGMHVGRLHSAGTNRRGPLEPDTVDEAAYAGPLRLAVRRVMPVRRIMFRCRPR